MTPSNRSPRTQYYFRLLVNGGYLQPDEPDGNGSYHATSRGQKLLENINATGSRIDLEEKLGVLMEAPLPAPSLGVSEESCSRRETRHPLRPPPG